MRTITKYYHPNRRAITPGTTLVAKLILLAGLIPLIFTLLVEPLLEWLVKYWGIDTL